MNAEQTVITLILGLVAVGATCALAMSLVALAASLTTSSQPVRATQRQKIRGQLL